jgi:hypothetical protein
MEKRRVQNKYRSRLATVLGAVDPPCVWLITRLPVMVGEILLAYVVVNDLATEREGGGVK